MTQHLYAFGSLCRGEIDDLSDVDLLGCVSTQDEAQKLDPSRFSVYTTERLNALWQEGNPFAWHLHLESKLVYSSDGNNFLQELGAPNTYGKAEEDCLRFRRLFEESLRSLQSHSDSHVFHLSCIFLAARNFATCYSFTSGNPTFSRLSQLQIDTPVPLSLDVFNILVRSRVLSTRGTGSALTSDEISMAIKSCPAILHWMEHLMPLEALT